MILWQIEIGSRVYQGAYRAAADAVFGAMRKDENELRDQLQEEGRTWSEIVEYVQNAQQRIEVSVLETGPYKLSYRGRARRVA